MLCCLSSWCQSAPRQGCLSIPMDCLEYSLGALLVIDLHQIMSEQCISNILVCSFGFTLFCTQNTVNSWRSSISSSGSVQRMIRNSKELDSLKVWRTPGSLSRSCHMPRVTRAGTLGCCCPFWLKLPVQCGGFENCDIVSSPENWDWFLSFIYLRNSLCFLPFFLKSSSFPSMKPQMQHILSSSMQPSAFPFGLMTSHFFPA